VLSNQVQRQRPGAQLTRDCGALQLCDPAQQPGVDVGDGDAGQVGDVGQGEGGGDRNAVSLCVHQRLALGAEVELKLGGDVVMAHKL